MKIAVTGANGYIGRYVVKNLLDLGHKVIAVDINTSEIDSRASIVTENIFLDNPDIFVRLGSPDVCLHMAWKDGFIHNSDAHMQCLSSHYTFIKNMIGGGLKQIAVMGSMHEAGYHIGAIDEDTPCNPISMYGIAKDSLRRSIMLLAKSSDVIFQWLRAYYIYGDDIRNNSIFAKIMLAAEENKKTFPFTTGKNKYDFISINELARQIAACVSQHEISGIINCCSGKPVSLSEMVENFIKENDLNIELEYGVYPDREYDSPEIYGDNTKITSILEVNKK